MSKPWSATKKVLVYGAAFGVTYTAVTYIIDVLIRPALVARDAIKYARSVGKPIINVGAGTPGSSLRVAMLGPTLWGDVNIDIAAPRDVTPGPNVVSFGDAHHIAYPDKHFGALIASHVLEHMDDPLSAIKEFQRVADRVYIITPRWWAPHTWLHPGHQWTIDDSAVNVSGLAGLGSMRPLHRAQQNRRLLAAHAARVPQRIVVGRRRA